MQFHEVGMQFQKVGNIKICYKLFGAGYPLVLISGFTSSMDWWDPEMIEYLSRKYKVLIFDNRGAGRTETPENEVFTIEMFANDTVSLMRSLGIDRANIIGYSLGGLIAQALALKYSQNVNRLVLCSTFPGGKDMIPPSREVMKIFMDKSGGYEEQFKRNIFLMFPDSYFKSNIDYFLNFKERYMEAPISLANAKRQFVAGLSTSTYDHLHNINIPTLVMTGEEDILIPPENSEKIAEQIPRAKLIKYKGAGHGFMSQMRDCFLEDLSNFFPA